MTYASLQPMQLLSPAEKVSLVSKTSEAEFGFPNLEGETYKFPYTPKGVSVFSFEGSSHLSGRNSIASGPQTSWFLSECR